MFIVVYIKYLNTLLSRKRKQTHDDNTEVVHCPRCRAGEPRALRPGYY